MLQQLVLTVLQLRHSSFGHCWAAVGARKSQRDPRPLTNRLNSFVAAARHTRPRTRARTSSRAHPSVRPSLQLPQLSSSSSLSTRPSLPLARFSFSPALPRAVSLICSFPFSSLLFLLLLPHSHFSPSFIFFASLIHLFIRSLSLSLPIRLSSLFVLPSSRTTPLQPLILTCGVSSSNVWTDIESRLASINQSFCIQCFGSTTEFAQERPWLPSSRV